MRDVKSRVLDVLEEVLGIERSEIDLHASIREQLAPDSLDQVTLFMTLNDEFDGELAPEDIEQIVDVADVIDFISKAGLRYKRS